MFKNVREMALEKINLQLFADDGGEGVEGGTGGEGGAGGETGGETGGDSGGEGKEGAKYTDEDVNRILDKKFAEWQKKHEKKISEAERLSRMTAEEKANERMKALETKIQEYEANAAKAEMMKEARSILQGKNISANDDLVSALISDSAEATKAAVDNFCTLFNAAVDAAVKKALKGEAPRAGANAGITKEQIMKVTNRAERQRLINENIHLFK